MRSATKHNESMMMWSWNLSLLVLLLCISTMATSASAQPVSPEGELPRRLNHARELLQWFDIDQQRLATFVDAQPLSSSEEEILWEILFRLPSIPQHELTRWSQNAPPRTTFLLLPNEHRADAVLVRGRTTGITRVTVPAAVANRLGFDHYYRVALQLENTTQSALICTRSIPATWPIDGALEQPVSALGLFLKVDITEHGSPQLLFVADHIAWHPDTPDESLDVSNDQVFLASQGLDVGLFDDVRHNNRQPIAASERECFYQLLATVGRAEPAGFRSRAHAPVDLVALLEQTDGQHGRLFLVRGIARRVLEVRIDEPDIRERLGLDHYYQIDVFLPLDKRVRLSGEANSTDGPVFTNSYPVTVCVLQLPPELPVSLDCREEVQIPAAFWKLWAYDSRFVSEIDRNEFQVSPLFMGSEPSVVQPQVMSESYLRWGSAGAFLAVLGAIWWLLWRSSRRDVEFGRDVVLRRFEVERGQSLNDAGITTRDDPGS